MYLGIDLGTSSLKAVVIGQSQNICATAEFELTVNYTNGNWSEQNPRQWEVALSQVCLELAAQVKIYQIQRIVLITTIQNSMLTRYIYQALKHLPPAMVKGYA